MSLCVVTCGPASTRIDDVRRITNFSTGELGALLVDALLAAGHEVICLQGEGATFPIAAAASCESFFSNDDVLRILENISATREVSHFFHAAALTDFEVSSVTNLRGEAVDGAKIPSTTPELHITLRPARKIIPELRRLFPHAQITGWKYELTGTPAEVLQKAHEQIRSCRTDACVLNGAAHGPGFTWTTPDRNLHLPNKQELVKFLAKSIVGE
ncbi:MAG TPA: phosphopantothenoylcysteine decarboxylase [Chthoniobacterales bacterium]|jgi:phosphopantothenoylcysteine synthetase/decarboxylase